MSMSNRERVGRALELLGQDFKPFFERQMKSVYGERWLAQASLSFERGLRDNGALKDVHALLKVTWDQWRQVFGKTLGQTERTLVSELRDDRNRWAHQESFSFDDAYRSLDSSYRLLAAISAGDEASEVAASARS